MKKNMMISILCVLLTSCYSYKKVDLKQVEFSKEDKYRIYRIGKPTKKGKFHSMNDSLIILNGRNGQMHEVSLKEIEKIKRRKFSWGKTIALPFGVVIGTAGVLIVIDSGPGIGNIEFQY